MKVRVPPRTTAQTLHGDYKESSLLAGNEGSPVPYAEARAQHLHRMQVHYEQVESLTQAFMDEGESKESAEDKARRLAVHPDFIESDNIAGHARMALYVRKEVS